MRNSQSAISVLCVDDEPGLAELTGTFLERFDSQFSTSTAVSAQEGLTHLDEDEVDCVVSDHDMPGMDGLAFLEAVRATDPDRPFILYTGCGPEEIASDAISAGVSDYMQKAAGNDQYTVLGQRIRNVVTRYRASREKLEAEPRAETILGASPDAILVSAGGVFVYANPVAADLYGVPEASDLLGRRVGEFIHPDYRETSTDNYNRSNPDNGPPTISRERC